MASRAAIAGALARLRADRPGLGLEESIDAHWEQWFSRPKFFDDDILTAVNWYLQDTPGRTWPTVAEIERWIGKVERYLREAEEAAEACDKCSETHGLVYAELEEPYPHTALVPCKCKTGQRKAAALRASLEAGEVKNRHRLPAELEESAQ